MAASILWISYSDDLVATLPPDVSLQFQKYKALGFVFVTGVLLFLMLRRHIVQERLAHDVLVDAHHDLIQCLAQAGEWRDDETGEHVLRVSFFAYEIAKEYGLREQECQAIRLAATTHDIGKIGVPDAIVMYEGKYDDAQRAQMQAHTLIGGQILRGGHGELAETARAIAVSHHERWDGTGYPAGLRGEEIPLAARIAAVADVFDALLSHRRYKEAWNWEDSVKPIRGGAGAQFDPDVVAAFVRAEDALFAAWQSHRSSPLDEVATELKLAG